MVSTQAVGGYGELEAAEEWFRRQGLPWFVDAVDDRVRELLGRRRLWALLAGVAVVAAAAGWCAWATLEDAPSAGLVAVVVAIGLLLAYAGGPLRVSIMARWAARRVLAELDLLLPLVSRALPLLLLFMTFLFINTEVWQVASTLPRSSLYATVLLFSVLGVSFLLTKLPEEVRRVQQAAAGEGLVQACRGTPVEQVARTLADARAGVPAPDGDEPLSPTQRANLLLVLLVTQAFQVLFLALAVFVFFVCFGLLAITPAVIRAWIGHPPTAIRWDWGIVQLHLPVSSELYQVSVFLSAFAGLYFTVYAVSDAGYREQFFGELSHGLEQALGVREVYRTLARDGSSARE
ncbi:MAG TPA: hypothetical protein VFP72_13970 [Kineosporiaceae bacterium]|nr:hypothetical protein [Kineosporiaceae bacterium]